MRLCVEDSLASHATGWESESTPRSGAPPRDAQNVAIHWRRGSRSDIIQSNPSPDLRGVEVRFDRPQTMKPRTHHRLTMSLVASSPRLSKARLNCREGRRNGESRFPETDETIRSELLSPPNPVALERSDIIPFPQASIPLFGRVVETTSR